LLRKYRKGKENPQTSENLFYWLKEIEILTHLNLITLLTLLRRSSYISWKSDKHQALCYSITYLSFFKIFLADKMRLCFLRRGNKLIFFFFLKFGGGGMAPTEPPFSVTGQKLSPNLTLISCYAIHFMSFYFTSPASSLSSAPSAFCASLSGAFFSLCDLLYAISSLSAISTEIHCVLGTALSRYCSLSPSLPLRCLGAWGLVQRVMGL
jgi:hypothetical protein